MALVTSMSHQALEGISAHADVDCTFDVIIREDGVKFLQIDTYGSKRRKLAGKKSQSLRLAPSAIKQLKEIFIKHQL